MKKFKIKRIGKILCEETFITQSQLDRALKVQKTDKKRRQLGQILLDLNSITKSQLDKAIAIQGKMKKE